MKRKAPELRDDGTYTKYRGMEVEFYKLATSFDDVYTLRSTDKKSLELGFTEYAEGIYIKRDIPRSELGKCFIVENYAKVDGYESMFEGPDKNGLIWMDTDDEAFAEKYEHFLYERGLYCFGVPMEKCKFYEKRKRYKFEDE